MGEAAKQKEQSRFCFMSCISDVSSKEETTKIDPFFGPQMGLFFFVWFHASVSSPGEEKPLKNDFGAKQAHTESEGDAQLRKFIRELPLEPHFRMVQPHPTVDS